MIGPRYEYSPTPIIALNALQLRTRDRVQASVDSGEFGLESPGCCICAGSDWELLSERDRYGLAMSVCACRDCGLVQTVPRMDARSYAKFYERDYRALYTGAETPPLGFFENQRIHGRYIVEHLATHSAFRPRDARVVEVGAGAGGILSAFRDAGATVRGCDYGREYVEYGRREHGLDLVSGPLDALDLKSGVDLFVYSHVFEHLLDPVAELEKVHELLAEGGHVYIEVPGLRNIHLSHRGDFLMYLQNAHTYHFTATTLEHLAGKHGFVPAYMDEGMFAILRKGGADARRPESDYPQIVDELRRRERWRALNALHPEVLERWARGSVLATLRALRLEQPMRRLLGRV